MSKVLKAGDYEYTVLVANEPPVLMKRTVEVFDDGRVWRSPWTQVYNIPLEHAEAILTFFKEQSQ